MDIGVEVFQISIFNLFTTNPNIDYCILEPARLGIFFEHMLLKDKYFFHHNGGIIFNIANQIFMNLTPPPNISNI